MMMKRFKKFLRTETGQSTTEYALVLLAVVALASVLSTVGVKGMTEFLTGVFAKLAASVK
jgi:Flp pilus assembly pilin Flp